MEDVVRLFLLGVACRHAASSAGLHELFVSYNRLLSSPPGGIAAREFSVDDSTAGVGLYANQARPEHPRGLEGC